VALNRVLIHVPGVNLRLPDDGDLAGVAGPSVMVVVDAEGRFYFDNQVLTETLLQERLTEEVRRGGGGLTLIVRADKAVRHETLIRLGALARQAGIRNALLATRPALSLQPEAPQP